MKMLKLFLASLALVSFTANAAEVRESFPVLEDQTTGAGYGWHKSEEDDPVSGLNAGPVMPVKDESGNIQYIPMTDGKISVTFESADIADLFDYGTHAGDKTAFQDLASITLQNSLDYRQLAWIVSCFRSTTFEIVWVDDASENILARVRTGPGNTSMSDELEHINFTSGASGTQTLKIRGKNLVVASTMDASLAIQENQ